MHRLLRTGLIAILLVGILVSVGGCTLMGTEGEEGSGSIWPMIIFLVVIFALFYFVMIRPQQKRQKEHQNMMQELQRGDKVMTAGGIYGTIDSVNEDNVVIKVEGGTTLRIARTSIVQRREM
jgi:preprotein translocase subunit YajC